jgi:hypothetical protein
MSWAQEMSVNSAVPPAELPQIITMQGVSSAYRASTLLMRGERVEPWRPPAIVYIIQ